jgi:hypothetical protein
MKVIKRIRGQKLPENTVYVGRPSKWGNPFTIDTGMSAKEAVQAFKDYIEYHSDFNPELDPKQLKGKNLACWCGNWEIGEPEIDCHAVVLLKMANGNPELMPNGEIWTDDTVIGLTEKGREQFFDGVTCIEDLQLMIKHNNIDIPDVVKLISDIGYQDIEEYLSKHNFSDLARLIYITFVRQSQESN